MIEFISLIQQQKEEAVYSVFFFFILSEIHFAPMATVRQQYHNITTVTLSDGETRVSHHRQ